MDSDQPIFKERISRFRAAAILTALVGVATALRFFQLGTTFNTSDNVELAARILSHPGYEWMLHELYGVLINVWVKLCVGLLSLAGVTITEFWWIAPVALVGTLQTPLTYLFLRRLHCGRAGALFGAAFMAILPVHVFESRYLWGFEILGVFFVILAFWSLLAFFEQPSFRKGLAASAFSGFYLISHVNIVPFAACVVLAALLLGPPGRGAKNLVLLVTRFVWLIPAAFLVLAHGPIVRLLQKNTRLGFYLPDHFATLVSNAGLPLTLLLGAAVVLAFVTRDVRTRPALFLALSGAAYLAPLIFGAPPGITIVRGYLMIGTCLLLAAGALTLDRLIAASRGGAWVLAASACFIMTAWASAECLFARRHYVGFPFCVWVAHGSIYPDAGFKTCGYIVRRNISPDTHIFAFSRQLEPPVLFYFFGRTNTAFYDISASKLADQFDKRKHEIDLVVCNTVNRPRVEQAGLFSEKAVIRAGGFPVLWIYGTDDVTIPFVSADVEEYNVKFDRDFAPRVSLK